MKSFTQFIAILGTISIFLVSAAFAQEAGNANMEILAQKLKADKKLLVAMNMDLTDAESKGFWPVYESYQANLQQMNKRLGQLVDDYARAYNSGVVSDETAGKLIKDFLHMEAVEMKLRLDNVKELTRVLPSKKVMRYLQIESKIRAVIRYQIAEGVPLVY